DAFSPNPANRSPVSESPVRESPVSESPVRESPVRESPADQRPAPASPGRHLGMPVRVPQASLAPQLRGRGDGGQPGAGTPGPDVEGRSPEATRSMMILMQQGWEQGRVDDLDEPAGAPDNGTDR
ncbi:MAG TPA: hypothetical protein VHZ33_13895, partial [Trebonia sp.]|nr:hypothetical protein [Trebonia sp.]